MTTKTLISERWEVIPLEWGKWFENQKTFLAPLGILYLGYVISRVASDGVAIVDFLPDNALLTGVALYVLNALYDIFRKWAGAERYVVPKNP